MSTLVKTYRSETTYSEAEARTGGFERWAPIAGIAFVVLMVVGSALVSDVPAPDAPGREIADYLADSGNLTRNIVGAYLWAIGALVFLWFLVPLRNRLRRAEGGTGSLSSLAFGAGLAFTAVWLVSAVVLSAVPFAIEFRDATISDPDLVRVLGSTGRLLLLLGAGFAALLVVLAASLAGFRTGVFPRWLAWLGIVASVSLLFAVVYGNILPFWTWVFLASIVMWRRPVLRTSS
jgi:hypothetical protein